MRSPTSPWSGTSRSPTCSAADSLGGPARQRHGGDHRVDTDRAREGARVADPDVGDVVQLAQWTGYGRGPVGAHARRTHLVGAEDRLAAGADRRRGEPRDKTLELLAAVATPRRGRA